MSMKMTSRRAMVIAGALAVGAVAASVGVANASANNKQPEYDSTADSSAGLDVLGSLSADLPSVVVIGETDSHSDTEDNVDTDGDDGADSTSSASSLSLLGNDIGGAADCESHGTDNQGVDRDKDADQLLALDADPAPVSVTVLSASCESRAVQANNASSSAKASVVEADVAGTQIVVLGSSSSTKTTSGQAGSGQTESSFTVVSVGDTTLLGCSSHSHTTKGSSDSGSSVTVLGTEAQDTDCPLTSASTGFTPSNE